ncbi:hypothetical protein M0813_16321 [Anaeramoeba flamelloides]|uniref:Uncharacterized protein n=1 Tax=Anaeramoeba flamelloides TaxID=1746091 RepID=A0ABQ8Z058_9EUKA|nr:hypothetical protein M0813_16321 [Anaeramoeba flamelloides]
MQMGYTPNTKEDHPTKIRSTFSFQTPVTFNINEEQFSSYCNNQTGTNFRNNNKNHRSKCDHSQNKPFRNFEKRPKRMYERHPQPKLTNMGIKKRKLRKPKNQSNNQNNIQKRPSAPKNVTASLIHKIEPFWSKKKKEFPRDFSIDDFGSFEGLIDSSVFESPLVKHLLDENDDIDEETLHKKLMENEKLKDQKNEETENGGKVLKGKPLYHSLLLSYIKRLRNQNEELNLKLSLAKNELSDVKQQATSQGEIQKNNNLVTKQKEN